MLDPLVRMELVFRWDRASDPAPVKPASRLSPLVAGALEVTHAHGPPVHGRLEDGVL